MGEQESRTSARVESRGHQDMSATRRLHTISAHLTAEHGKSSSNADTFALRSGDTVCVTGAAGYVGGWLVRLLLEGGYSVRACVRDTNDQRKVGFLTAMPQYGASLSLHAADMTLPGAYDSTFRGCSAVFHAAEVFMSFGSGRDKAAATAKLRDPGTGGLITEIHNAAITACRNIADSIEKSGTVRRLVYTSSVAAMMGSKAKSYHNDPCISELREPEGLPSNSYNLTKRVTEKFFDYAAAASGGSWTVVICNPSDILGPILSPHQARETWQGKLAGVLEGQPAPPEGRPWFCVDVRDIAKAQILLAKAQNVASGERFLCASGDVLAPEHLGERIKIIFPEWDVSASSDARVPSLWLRVYLRNKKVREAIGMNFRTLEDTLEATLNSLVQIGKVQPTRMNP